MRTAWQWTKVIMPTIDNSELTELVIEKIVKETWNEAINAASDTMNGQDTLKLQQEVILNLLK
jgi:hypothetical protein